jgi:hypothetical protein
MSGMISHNEAVIERRLADMAAIAPTHAASWEATIEMVKAAGKWDADNIRTILNAVVATLIAIEDMQNAEVL